MITESSEKTTSSARIWNTVATDPAGLRLGAALRPRPRLDRLDPFVELVRRLVDRNSPPASSTRSRPENALPSTVNRGFVSPISQDSANSSAMRSTSASPIPSWRTRARGARGFTFCDRIATSRTLSIPRTISMTVRLTRLDQPFGREQRAEVEHGGEG